MSEVLHFEKYADDEREYSITISRESNGDVSTNISLVQANGEQVPVRQEYYGQTEEEVAELVIAAKRIILTLPYLPTYER